jgi:CspA family cold shock protein
MKTGETWLGTVKWYNSSRGRGYITADNGLDVPVHHTGIAGSGVKLLDENQRVRFEIGERENRQCAVNVVKLDPPQPLSR